MANVTGLAAARHALLARAGWDVEEHGLNGSPPLRVFAGEEAHVTVWRALRLLGIGRAHVEVVPADDQGAMRADALPRARRRGPTIVCAQAGNVNTGAFDPLAAIVARGARARRVGARRRRVRPVGGGERRRSRTSPPASADADSWATDGAQVAQRALRLRGRRRARPRGARRGDEHAAAYLIRDAPARARTPTGSPRRRAAARGFAVYAALRSLGRAGVAELVERNCALARRMAERLAAGGRRGAQRRRAQPGAGRRRTTTRRRSRRVQADGTCWVGGTRWHGRPAMRVSVSNWSTTEADVDRSADAILSAGERAADRGDDRFALVGQLAPGEAQDR